MRISLVQKNIFLNILPVLIASVVISAVFYRLGTKILVDQALNNLSNQARNQEVRLSNLVEFLQSDVRFLSTTPPIQGLIRARQQGGYDAQDNSSEAQWKKRLTGFFTTLLQAKPAYLQVRLIDNSGQEIVRVQNVDGRVEQVPEELLQNKSGFDYVRTTLKLNQDQVYLSRINLNREHGEVTTPHTPVLRAATPILDSTHNAVGLVVINMGVRGELARIENLFATASQSIYITDNEGSFLVHPETAMRFSFDLGHRHRIQETYPRLASLFLPENDEIGRTLLPSDYHGDALVSTKVFFDALNHERFITITLAKPYDDIVSAEQRVLVTTSWIIAALLAVFIFFSYFVSRLASRPLQQISQAIGSFDLGKKALPLPTDRSDEIGQLARSFDTMSKKIGVSQEALEKLNEKLENAVAERTRELQLSESRQRAVFENIVDGIITIDEKGIIASFNPAAEIIFGRSANEAVGQNVNLLMPEPFQSMHDAYLREYFRTGEAKIIGVGREVTGRRKDGSLFPMDLAVNEMLVGGERLFTGIVRDITERKAADDDRQKNVTALQRFHALTSDPALDFEDKLNRLLQLGCDTFETDLGIVSRIEHDDYQIQAIVGPEDCPTAGARLDLGDSCCRFTLRADRPVAFHHADQNHPVTHPCYQALQLETYIGTPIGFQGLCYGTLDFSSIDARAQAFSSNELSLIQLFAQWIGAELERQHAEQELSQFKSTLDRTLDCVFMFDPETLVIFYVNQGALNQVGYSFDELLVMTPTDINPDISEAQFRSMIGPMVQGEKPVLNFETRHRHKDGHEIPVEIFLQYISPAGEAPRFVAIVHDIQERHRVDRMKNEFISTVSHELRTPLTSIRGSLGLVTGGAVGNIPTPANEMIKIAVNNTERLLLLINDILDIQKIESGKMAFRFEPLPLKPFLERAIQDNQAYADQYGVKLVLRSHCEDVRVYADQDRLMQVMSNLLSNAAKYSPEGDSVEVSIACQENTIRVAVSDHGPGIAAEFKPKLFDKFTQSDSSDTRQKGGTGLGLNIARLIVEKHGGRIDFVSRQNMGTTFFFELPAVVSEAKDLAVPTAENKLHAPSILIVEDDPDVAALLQRMLAGAGFNSDIASNAEQARRLLSAGASGYQAMTLDIGLPDEDGLSLLTNLRADADTRDLPVVIVSAQADEARRELVGNAVGVMDWLNKPIDPCRLKQVLRMVAGQSQLPRVLHVEDEQDVHRVVRLTLRDQCELIWATSVSAARESLLTETFDLVLLDIGLPDGSGLELLDTIEEQVTPSRVVIFSAHDVEASVAAKVSGVLIKSQSSNEQILKTVTTAMRHL